MGSVLCAVCSSAHAPVNESSAQVPPAAAAAAQHNRSLSLSLSLCASDTHSVSDSDPFISPSRHHRRCYSLNGLHSSLHRPCCSLCSKHSISSNVGRLSSPVFRYRGFYSHRCTLPRCYQLIVTVTPLPTPALRLPLLSGTAYTRSLQTLDSCSTHSSCAKVFLEQLYGRFSRSFVRISIYQSIPI